MKTIDTLLLIMATIISAIIVMLGAETLFTEPVTQWGGTSMTVALLLLIATTAVTWRFRMSFLSLTAFLYSTVLVGRLFGTLRLENTGSVEGATLDPLLVAETGPGVPNILYLSYLLVVLVSSQILHLMYRWRKQQLLDVSKTAMSINDWAITFIRVYVGLMFIAHYSGHVLAGPMQFQIFADYFSGVGFGIGAPMVVLAGVIEIAVSIGLVFGLMTRITAVVGALYLFFATLWGAHFTAGYIWVLPTGGWEFSALWIMVVLAFAMTGGSNESVDAWLRPYTNRMQGLGWVFK